MIDPNDKNLPVIDTEDGNASEHVKMSRRLFFTVSLVRKKGL